MNLLFSAVTESVLVHNEASERETRNERDILTKKKIFCGFLGLVSTFFFFFCFLFLMLSSLAAQPLHNLSIKTFVF